MNTGILLIDLQNDYLNRGGLVPSRTELVNNVEKLLSICRKHHLSIIHIQTVISKDGSNRMPHWKQRNQWTCVADTTGVEAPPSLKHLRGEYLLAKPYFSAFDAPEIESVLLANNIDTLIIAGVYTHACIRSSALDAYARGYKVIIASDAIASIEVEHADISLEYLKARSISFFSTREIEKKLAKPAAEKLTCSGWQQRNPCNWNEIIGHVSLSGNREIAHAVNQAHSNFLDLSDWNQNSQKAHQQALKRWLKIIRDKKETFIQLLLSEIAKPLTEAHNEFEYSLALLNYVVNHVEHEQDNVRYRPLGVIGLITPWNNPMTISISKLAPALAYGNSVVWKPALQVPRISDLLKRTLNEAGLGEHVQVIKGDANTGRLLAMHVGIKAVSLTGSVSSGKQVSAICAVHNKKFQGELGGNNPALILDDVNIEQVAFELAHAMFSFSGQRCTALRRLIVATQIKQEFEQALVNAINNLKIGIPNDPSTQIGPLISKDVQNKMVSLVSQSLTSGARLLCGGNIPENFTEGCWFEPTIIADPAPDARVVTEEVFGPVAVLIESRNFEHGVSLCNAVPQALIAALFTMDATLQNKFLTKVQAGTVLFNTPRPSFNPALPFSGWKDSSTGIPEHGRWDRDFYTQTQVIY